MLKKISSVGLACLLIFLVPSNLFYKLWENTAYHQGFFIDYLLVKIYLSDLVILTIFITVFANWLLKKPTSWQKKIKEYFYYQWRKNKLYFFLFLLFGSRQFFTPYPLASIWFLLKLIEMVALFFVLKPFLKNIFQDQKLIILSVFCFTLVFQGFIGLYQSIYQKPLLGYLLLGEGKIDQPIGISQAISSSGREYILPYGTTAHPNVLAGVAVIFLFIVWLLAKPTEKPKLVLSLKITATLSAGVILLLTQSLAAWLTLPTALCLVFFTWTKISTKHWLKKININKQKLAVFLALSLLVISPIIMRFLSPKLPASFSLTRRARLNQEAFKLTKQNLVWGVGLNQFTTYLPTYIQAGESAPFMQPVHNMGWLWLSETGLLGLLLVIFTWKKLITQKEQEKGLIVAIIFLVLAGSDHYLLTSQTGLLLIVITSSMLTNFSKKIRV